jgi:tetratricopeptide (TPR) repeat protein
LLAAKQFPAARDQFSAAKSLAPTDPSPYVETALAYAGENQDAAAEKEFAATLQVDPHSTAALDRWAQFLVSRSRRAEAITRTKQYLANSPKDANAHCILGWLYAGDKQYSEAEAEFLQALALDPKSERANLELGNVYRARGDTDQAISQYQKVLAVQPKLAPVQVIVGNLFGNDGQGLAYYTTGSTPFGGAGNSWTSVDPVPVPEPSVLMLALLGLVFTRNRISQGLRQAIRWNY